MAQKLPFLNVFWLRMGFSVNVIASILAVYGSFMAVFFSDNSLDMILNSVALFFVAELDDLLVKSSDYSKIKERIVEFKEDERKRRQSGASDKATGCCNGCKKCVNS